jgi:hypothetical protein
MGKGLNMKAAFVDPATGWLVTREPVVLPAGVTVIDTTITDPGTGDSYHSRRVANCPLDIEEWVRDITDSKAIITGLNETRANGGAHVDRRSSQWPDN